MKLKADFSKEDLPILIRLINYSYADVEEYKYLTSKEKRIISEEEFNRLFESEKTSWYTIGIKLIPDGILKVKLFFIPNEILDPKGYEGLLFSSLDLCQAECDLLNKLCGDPAHI